jgi:hypothetical protein
LAFLLEGRDNPPPFSSLDHEHLSRCLNNSPAFLDCKNLHVVHNYYQYANSTAMNSAMTTGRASASPGATSIVARFGWELLPARRSGNPPGI